MNVTMKSRVRERRMHGSVRGLRREPLVYSTVQIYKLDLMEEKPWKNGIYMM